METYEAPKGAIEETWRAGERWFTERCKKDDNGLLALRTSWYGMMFTPYPSKYNLNYGKSRESIDQWLGIRGNVNQNAKLLFS